ncbi:MAG: T9SS type A sorting domain-containing protein, partial [Cytophagales bacterium]
WARQNNFNNSMLNDTNPGEFFTVAIEGNIAYAVTDIDEEGQIFYTTFSGTSTTLTWNAMKFADKGATDYYMAQEKGRGITITPNGTIWNAAAQYLLKATNTSATFQVVTVAGSADEIEIRGVSFFDDSKGAFANANGDVFVTTNAGVNWSLLGNVPSEPKAIIYSPAGKSLAVAADAGSGVPGTFLTNICTPPLITVVTSTLPLGVVCTAASAPIWANAGDKDIYFHAYSDENTVFAGGSDGLAGKGTYSNGKWTFSTLTIAGASDANFRAGYFFPNTTVGFFANDDAKLFKTIDGGTTFSEIAGFNTAVEEGDVNHLVFAPAPNQNIGFAAAQGGLFVTTNGGSNWTQQTMFTNSMLNATNPGEFFTVAIQGTKAYAVTDIDEEGQIFYADILASGTDFTWNAMKFADKGATDYYMAQEKGRSIAITPNGTIWNVAAQYLLKATSFDATFQLVTVAGSADEIEIRGVAFYDNNNGAFANGNGDVFVTANAGGTWTKIGNVPSEPKAIAISPLGTTFAVAADVAGTVVGTFISSRCTSIADPTSTLEDVASENQNIYPNPATHVINMQLNANDTWSLCDLTGSVLKSGNTAANTLISENISDLASGIYIVKVASAKGTKAIKLYKTN